MQPADAGEETDHEIVELLDHKMKDGLMHIRVLMESYAKIYKSYKIWAPLKDVFQDCQAEALEYQEESLLLDYARKQTMCDENDMKLCTEIACLTKQTLKFLFPNLIGKKQKEKVDHQSQKKKCEADHDEKFAGGDYKEVPYGAFYFTGEEKWSKEKCWFCDKELAKLKPKNQAPAMVCEHIYHDKGTCEKGFLCNACYGKKQITEKGGRRRRTTRAS